MLFITIFNLNQSDGHPLMLKDTRMSKWQLVNYHDWHNSTVKWMPWQRGPLGEFIWLLAQKRINGEPWSIWKGPTEIVHNWHNRLYDLAHGEAAQCYWAKRK